MVVVVIVAFFHGVGSDFACGMVAEDLRANKDRLFEFAQFLEMGVDLIVFV